MIQAGQLLPLGLDIRGRKKLLLIKACDLLFPLDRNRLHPLAKGQLLVDPRHANERFFFHFLPNMLKTYKRSALFRYMQQRLHPGDLYLDVGANFGFYSMLAKSLGARSYVFEPEPTHLEFLRRNPCIYDRLFDVAVSNRSGTVEFFVSGEHDSGASSLVGMDGTGKGGLYVATVQVQSQRLDQLIDEQDMARLRLVKIDVEGHEEYAVEGMQAMLKKGLGFDIWCEVRGPQSGRNPDSCRRVSDFLAGFGYRAFVFDGRQARPFTVTDTRQVFDLLYLRDPARVPPAMFIDGECSNGT